MKLDRTSANAIWSTKALSKTLLFCKDDFEKEESSKYSTTTYWFPPYVGKTDYLGIEILPHKEFYGDGEYKISWNPIDIFATPNGKRKAHLQRLAEKVEVGRLFPIRKRIGKIRALLVGSYPPIFGIKDIGKNTCFVGWWVGTHQSLEATQIHLQVEDVGMLEGCFAVLGLEFLKHLFLHRIF